MVEVMRIPSALPNLLEKLEGSLKGSEKRSQLALNVMSAADLDEIVVIEQSAYRFPWSCGNFEDSLVSGYTGLCLRDRHAHLHLLGYSVLMPVLDEVHLLNLCIAPVWQRQGLGAYLLSCSIIIAREHGFASMLLEVRPSNLGALRLYEHFGFELIGRRKNYYPNSLTTPAQQGREDALVMRLELGIKQITVGGVA